MSFRDRAMNGDERAQELVLQAMLYRPDLTGLKPTDRWTQQGETGNSTHTACTCSG